MTTAPITIPAVGDEIVLSVNGHGQVRETGLVQWVKPAKSNNAKWYWNPGADELLEVGGEVTCHYPAYPGQYRPSQFFKYYVRHGETWSRAQ